MLNAGLVGILRVLVPRGVFGACFKVREHERQVGPGSSKRDFSVGG